MFSQLEINVCYQWTGLWTLTIKFWIFSQIEIFLPVAISMYEYHPARFEFCFWASAHDGDEVCLLKKSFYYKKQRWRRSSLSLTWKRAAKSIFSRTKAILESWFVSDSEKNPKVQHFVDDGEHGLLELKLWCFTIYFPK